MKSSAEYWPSGQGHSGGSTLPGAQFMQLSGVPLHVSHGGSHGTQSPSTSTIPGLQGHSGG